MSTKLYDGLMFEGSYLELSNKLKGVSEKIAEEARLDISKIVSRSICLAYDAINAGVKLDEIRDMITPFDSDGQIKFKEGQDLFWTAYSLCNILAKGKKSNVVTYPLTETKILAYPFINGPHFKFEDIEGFKEYGYWNNSDMPKELTESEWEQRKKDWDTIGEGRFVDGAFSFLLFDEGNFMFHRHFKFIPPTPEKRSKTLKIYANLTEDVVLAELPEKILEVKIETKTNE